VALIGGPRIDDDGDLMRALYGGLNIQKTSIRLFENNAQPGGILAASGDISNADAERIKTMWEEKFGGDNMGPPRGFR
jgi:hypothetical protein